MSIAMDQKLVELERRLKAVEDELAKLKQTRPPLSLPEKRNAKA